MNVMSVSLEVEEYNYAVFVGSEEYMAFRMLMQVGSPAADFNATLLETGETVRLSDYWKKNDVLIEFGSLT